MKVVCRNAPLTGSNCAAMTYSETGNLVVPNLDKDRNFNHFVYCTKQLCAAFVHLNKQTGFFIFRNSVKIKAYFFLILSGRSWMKLMGSSVELTNLIRIFFYKSTPTGVALSNFLPALVVEMTNSSCQSIGSVQILR